MIFVGDIALPFNGAIDYEFPNSFKNKCIIGNLEGALVTDSPKYIKSFSVVNEFQAIQKLCQKGDFKFSLNNNHIFDNDDFDETIRNLKELKLNYFGAGDNLSEASKPLFFDNEKVVVLNFGWSVVGCKYASKASRGVNPMTENYVIAEVKKYIHKKPDYKIFTFFHWDYELEKYPLPKQRSLSHKLIDIGVELVIGTHSHRVQGFEYYKNKPIIYSLGNFLFAQNIYWNGTLNYPDFCSLELAFEFDLKGNHICHFFDYNKENNKLFFLKSEYLSDSKIMNELSDFSEINSENYDSWFSKNRYHKKLIPIYRWNDNVITVTFKDYINFVRNLSIKLLMNLRIKRFIKLLFNN